MKLDIDRDRDALTIEVRLYNHVRIRRVWDLPEHWVVERRDPLPDAEGRDVWTWVEVARFPVFASTQVGGAPEGE